MPLNEDNEIATMLHTKQETDELICRYLNAKTHWMIIASTAAHEVVIPLEEKYFSGERNKDFIAVMYPHKGQMFCFYFAAKKYLSPDQFFQMCKDHGCLMPREAFDGRDIVFMCEDPQEMLPAAELLMEIENDQILNEDSIE